MENYYLLLNLGPLAPQEEIGKAIHREIRLWTNRQNHPDAERQLEAKKRIALLEDAEKILLDAARRADYDRQLAAASSTASSGPVVDINTVGDPVTEGTKLLLEDNIPAALRLAQRAVEMDAKNPAAWELLGKAQYRWGELDEAIRAYKTALQLRPADASFYFDLGSIYESANRIDEALHCYERASKSDPNSRMYRAAYGFMLAKSGQLADGMQILEQCVQEEPANPAYQWYLALAYRVSAYAGWTEVGEGHPLVEPGIYATNLDHVVVAREALNKALALKFDDHELTADLTELKAHIEGMTKLTFVGDWWKALIVGGLGYLMLKESYFLLASAVLYVAVSFVPEYVRYHQLVKGNNFDEFGWISRTFNRGDNNLVMLGIGFFVMVFAVPFFAIYNLYRYHGERIRRWFTSAQNKEKMSTLVAQMNTATRQTVQAAGGALQDIKSKVAESGLPWQARAAVWKNPAAAGIVLALAAGAGWFWHARSPGPGVTPSSTPQAPVVEATNPVTAAPSPLPPPMPATKLTKGAPDAPAIAASVPVIAQPQSITQPNPATSPGEGEASMPPISVEVTAPPQTQPGAQRLATATADPQTRPGAQPAPASLPPAAIPEAVTAPPNAAPVVQPSQDSLPAAQLPASPQVTMAHDAKSGCYVWKPSLKPNETVRWTGSCANSLADGHGEAEWFADGAPILKYEGTFKSGMQQGFGRMIAAGGDVYEGQYRDGKRDGRGTYVSATGERYEGAWKDNKREGQGILVRPDGSRFQGLFRGGGPETAGTATSSTNAR